MKTVAHKHMCLYTHTRTHCGPACCGRVFLTINNNMLLQGSKIPCKEKGFFCLRLFVSAEIEKSARSYLIYASKRKTHTLDLKCLNPGYFFPKDREYLHFFFQNCTLYWVSFPKIIKKKDVCFWCHFVEYKKLLAAPKWQMSQLLPFGVQKISNTVSRRKLNRMWFPECWWFIHVASL